MIAKSLKAIDAVLRTIRESNIRSLDSSLRLFNAAIVSIVSYATEVWAINYLDVIERVYCVFVKRLFLLSRYTASYIVRLETGYYNVKANIVKRILMNWVRLLEMSEDRLPRKCYRYYAVQPPYNV